MDVDVVLNACLETYQHDELQKAEEEAKALVRNQEVLTKSRTTKLFKNGRVYMDVVELTINQSVSQTPIFEIGNSRAISYVGRRQEITGQFLVDLDPAKYREMSPAYDTGVHNTWHIETEQVFSDGSIFRVRIVDMQLEETTTSTYFASPRVTYNYRALRTEPLPGDSNGR